MHVRRHVLTRNAMCNVLHNSVVHFFARRESLCVLCVRSWEERDEGVLVPLHIVDGAQ